MLIKKRARLVQKHSKIQAAIGYIALKQDFYDEVLFGRIEYFSNLVLEKEER